MERYRDRSDAGQRLTAAVRETLGEVATGSVVVLGVPRGGVVVAAGVAAGLGARLDVVLARKLPAPGNRELAIGAVGEGGDRWLNHDVIARLAVPPDRVEAAVARETAELERRAHRYRGVADAVDVSDRVAVVVDDGVATGATLAAALDAVARRRPARLVCAVPVGHPDSLRMLAGHGAEIVCPLRPRNLGAVGWWYDRFDQTTDDEVLRILTAAS